MRGPAGPALLLPFDLRPAACSPPPPPCATPAVPATHRIAARVPCSLTIARVLRPLRDPRPNPSPISPICGLSHRQDPGPPPPRALTPALARATTPSGPRALARTLTHARPRRPRPTCAWPRDAAIRPLTAGPSRCPLLLCCRCRRPTPWPRAHHHCSRLAPALPTTPTRRPARARRGRVRPLHSALPRRASPPSPRLVVARAPVVAARTQCLRRARSRVQNSLSALLARTFAPMRGPAGPALLLSFDLRPAACSPPPPPCATPAVPAAHRIAARVPCSLTRAQTRHPLARFVA
nr:proline-rich receptor-like protein kinase PERK2 [Aegilops tauschii subsp. strangulata]